MGQLIVVDDQLTLGSSQEGIAALGGDSSLSPNHAQVTRDPGGQWLVRDLGSEAGTLLNGRPLVAVEPLHRGDTLRLGDTKLLVLEGPAREPQRRATFAPSAEMPPAETPPAELPPAQPREPLDSPQPIPPMPAPRLEDRIAPYRRRLRAAFIDGVIATAISIGVVLALGGKLLSTFVALAILLAWDFLFESLRGQTIGKRAMKIRVVRRDGTLLRPQHVAARNVLRLIDGLPGLPLVGALSMIISGPSRRQRLGDLAAGTIVVNSERAMSKLPSRARDRLVLAAYPILWLAPVIVWALATPGATTKICRTDLFSLQPPEETCVTRLPDGRGLGLLTAVNAGHTLHWQGYDISLRAARARQVRRTGGLATVVGYRLAVTNTGSSPAVFDQEGTRILLNVPVGPGEVRSAGDLSASVKVHGFHGIATSPTPIAPGSTRVGWVRFLVPSGAVGELNSTLAAITFLRSSGGGLPNLGYIDLWSPATPQGASAAHVRQG